MRPARHALVAVVALCLPLIPTRAEAAFMGPGDFDFSGTFANYNDEATFELSLPSPTLLTARTTSHATGGFDPVLTLFSNGTFLQQNDDEDPSGIFDSLIMLTLEPGTYSVVLTQSPNFYEPQFGRFGYAGTGCDESEAFAPCDDPFLGNTGNFAGQIVLTTVSAPMPEPGALVFVGLGLAALVRGRRKRRGG